MAGQAEGRQCLAKRLASAFPGKGERKGGVINTISKLTKTCTLRLTVCKLYFILSDKVANGGASMWCELCQGNFFDEFQMEGVAAEHNEIYLEFVPENLSRALKTAHSAKAVKIKLTNKHCPCLRVAVELVSIYLPVLKTMKSVVERMKNLSNFIVIEANLSGEMNLKIETDLVSVTTHFKDLGNPPWASEDGCQSSAQGRDLESMAEARIDIKKLQQLLAGQQVNPTKALCNIMQRVKRRLKERQWSGDLTLLCLLSLLPSY
ncbi:checkpoint protein HUS1 isoform X6 [Corapipo altera]|uniref:checkpoint protein HUS1 isoform X6 n=1 Tax=Corapipo altera TaxID=415028 RepID=UPI000FD67594|nr:checkpoint protein HUS1 isoform X6 [Corapipo altera]